MCTVAVKRRLVLVPSIRSANSRSVLPTGCSEGLVRRRENNALAKRSSCFMSKKEADAPLMLRGEVLDLTPCYRKLPAYS